MGSMCNWNIAELEPDRVPGSSMISVITPSSALRMAPNSFG